MSWAFINNGLVAEIIAVSPVGLYNPAMLWVDISSVTPAPQVGWTATETAGVWSFAAPASPPAPTLAQQAATLIAGGLTITSTGTPALNGVYSVQSGVNFGQQDIATEAQFITTFSEFTNGSTTALEWPLLSGAMVTFATTTEFLNFAKAAAQFIATVKNAVATSGTLPSATATIP